MELLRVVEPAIVAGRRFRYIQNPPMPKRILFAAPFSPLLLVLLVLLVLFVTAGLATPPASASPQTKERSTAATDRLERAQALIDAERPDQALALLEPLPDGGDLRAQALLLTSTAKLMLGRVDEGRADLDRALELDPMLRQGWLNRAGLEIAAGRYDAALEALETASRLDPEAEDNHLNIGAVFLLQGRLGEATKHFERYLAAARNPAEASYLVAKNYAGGGYARLGVENLRRAVELDERYRLSARIDPAFRPISESPELKQLLETDTYEPPSGHWRLVRTFDARFDAGDGPILSATLEALRTLGEPFDPRVEVAPSWAVIHGERLRVKISDSGPTDGEAAEVLLSAPTDGEAAEILLSAPPEAFTSKTWAERTGEILRQVQIGLIRRQRPKGDQDTEAAPPDGA